MASVILQVLSISRHVLFSLITLATLGAMGYSIYMYMDCNKQTDNKSCALTSGEVICESAIFALIGISITIAIILITNITVTYKLFLSGLLGALCFEFIWFIISAATDSSNDLLTRRSMTKVLNEIRQCRVIENSTYMGRNTECWEYF
jgi:hypothetical protein